MHGFLFFSLLFFKGLFVSSQTLGYDGAVESDHITLYTLDTVNSWAECNSGT